jgi:NAD(P)-dependent dehydrogenase (short-subunit alcohol dehydrogenase family)
MRILITGCSSGFGLGTARLLAEQGHDVIATVRNPATATELRDLQASGLPITIESLDIRDAENARDVMTRVLENGGLDALVNNAGASIFAAVEATSIDQMRDLMETNLFGAVRLIQLVLPHMRRRKSGRIINVSSLSGIIPLPYLGAYGATKHALDAMSFSLAAEVRPFGIYVTIVSPSGFKTSITDKLWPAGIAVDEPAYETGTKIITQKMAGRLNNDPAPVFQAIADFLQTPNPPLRHLIGENAQKLSEMRRASSDAEWLEYMLAFQKG